MPIPTPYDGKLAEIDNLHGCVMTALRTQQRAAQWDDDPGMKAFHQFLEKYLPEASRADSSAMVGYNTAQSLVEVLRRCGDVLTRENVMKQAASLRNFEQGVLLPGITVNTSPTDLAPIKQLRLMRFEGDRWRLFGDVIAGAVGE
jgi:branched-chain amino acid transport system substrate-binding protein